MKQFRRQRPHYVMPRPTPLQIVNRKNSNPWKIVGKKKVWGQDHSQRSKADRMENREGEASVPSLFFILFLHFTFFFAMVLPTVFF